MPGESRGAYFSRNWGLQFLERGGLSPTPARTSPVDGSCAMISPCLSGPSPFTLRCLVCKINYDFQYREHPNAYNFDSHKWMRRSFV